MCQATYDWVFSALAPLWLRLVADSARSPWTGAYSVVYPVNETEVVKLVAEEGALQFLRHCEQYPDVHLPRVLEILPDAISDQASGQAYTAVRMERLFGDDAAMTRYSHAFGRRVRAEEARLDEDTARPSTRGSLAPVSAVAARALAEDVVDESASLADTLRRMAGLALVHDWVLDLAATGNWLVRPDRTVVLSDPVHADCNFADDLA